MTRRLIVILAIAMVVLAMMPMAFAEDNAGPCNDSGEPGNSDYAQHHIVVATPGHVPGTHGGFSLCLGTGRSVHKP